MPALARPEQARGNRRGEVLRPPFAVLEAGQRLHRRAARQADVAGGERDAAQVERYSGGLGRVAGGQVELRRVGQPGGDGIGPLAPAFGHLGGQGRRGRQARAALVERREHAVREPPRSAGEQRQARGDDRVRRGVEPQPLGQHHAQHRARLGVVRQALLRGAVDQRVEIDQPAQDFAGDGPGQRAVGVIAHVPGRRAQRLVERLAAAQHGVEHFERGAARGKTGGIGHRPSALCDIASRRQPSHLRVMSKRATKRPETFAKPAHWTSEPPPEPMAGDREEELSPTRYGDWVKKGIAIDF